MGRVKNWLNIFVLKSTKTSLWGEKRRPEKEGDGKIGEVMSFSSRNPVFSGVSIESVKRERWGGDRKSGVGRLTKGGEEGKEAVKKEENGGYEPKPAYSSSPKVISRPARLDPWSFSLDIPVARFLLVRRRGRACLSTSKKFGQLRSFLYAFMTETA
jgi:hypothetical protein